MVHLAKSNNALPIAANGISTQNNRNILVKCQCIISRSRNTNRYIYNIIADIFYFVRFYYCYFLVVFLSPVLSYVSFFFILFFSWHDFIENRDEDRMKKKIISSPFSLGKVLYFTPSNAHVKWCSLVSELSGDNRQNGDILCRSFYSKVMRRLFHCACIFVWKKKGERERKRM